MFKEGLGETSEFAGYHPWVNVTYYILAVGVTMFSLSPWFLAGTFLLSWVYSVLIRGRKIIRLNLIFTFWSLILMAVINVFFTHDGVTVFFYINDNAITLEALLFGFSSAVMLVSLIIWFTSFNTIVSADKLIFLFGKAAPVLGLTLTMIFRYIPLLKNRYEDVRLGQACLNAGEPAGFPEKMRQLGKEISILVSWSLESSIESADSMEARGYGLPGRTSFHLYRFTMRDGVLLAVMLLLGAVVVTGTVMGKTKTEFYPAYVPAAMDAAAVVILACYLLLLALPVIIDIRGELKWKRSALTM